MLTPTELNNILKQVNTAFIEVGKKLDKVAERVTALENAKESTPEAKKK